MSAADHSWRAVANEDEAEPDTIDLVVAILEEGIERIEEGSLRSLLADYEIFLTRLLQLASKKGTRDPQMRLEKHLIRMVS